MMSSAKLKSPSASMTVRWRGHGGWRIARALSAGIAAGALSLGTLGTSAAHADVASTSTSTSSTQSAVDSAYAAAYRTSQAAQGGFHSVATERNEFSGGAFESATKTEAWRSGWFVPDSAMVKTSRYRKDGTVTVYKHGSTTWPAQPNRALTGWYSLPGDKATSKADQKILNKLPKGAKLVIGAAHGGSLRERFQPNDIVQGLENNRQVPWALWTLLDSCVTPSETNPPDCTGSVTGDGMERQWDFTITSPAKEYLDDMSYAIVVNSNSDGLIDRLEYTQTFTSDGFTSKVLVTADNIDADYPDGVAVPTPALSGRGIVTSEDLTRAAAQSSLGQLKAAFTKAVKTQLNQAGKDLTEKRLGWAIRKMGGMGGGWASGANFGNSWVNSSWAGQNKNEYSFGVTAEDGLTVTDLSANITVKNGKLKFTVT